ncbi:MAG TPA: cupin domain-containing protein [Gaiellaceae bacterium]|nr:cupin domain-containing protein [Gaiellaceae bacterium]
MLQALHVHWHPLAVFCRQLEEALGHGMQANAYWTPRGSQGFAVHHDTHDVLVLQVAGEKRWLLYDPVLELPLKHQRWSAELGDPGEPTEELVLRAGDTLYLPRGWPHQAETSDTDSLHLTVGIDAYTWLDAVRAALADCEDELPFRRGIDGGTDAPGELLELLRARLGAEDVERRRRRRFLERRRPIREDGLSQLRALARLDVETPVERRPTVIADVEEDADALTLVFEGKELRLPPHARAELLALVDAEEPLTAAELPGELDDAGRLVLVRRLVREGFLRVTRP